MKKRTLLILSMAFALVCVLAISASAVSTTGNIDYEEKATLKDGTVLPIYDEDKNPLIWYISGTETVTVDGVETTKNIYSSVVSTATKANPDKNGYYVVYNGPTNTYTGATGEKLQYHYSQSIYIKHITDTSVNVLCKDVMIVANMRGVNVGDFQGGTINKLQYLYAPDCMVKSGDLRYCGDLLVADYTQSTSLRLLMTEIIKTKTCDLRLPTLEPVLDENGVLVNAFTVASFCFQGSQRTVIELPKTLYAIEKNAFQNCSKLTSLGYTPYLTIIGNDAFHNASSITGIDFKSLPLQSIGERAFWNAGLQAEIQLPSTLTNVGTRAFYQAKLVKSITLPENLVTLGGEAFREITSLEYFDFNGFEMETIGDYFFWKNSSLRAVSLPEGLKSFGTRPFENCTKLEILYLPDGLTQLTYFQGLKKLYFVNDPFSIDWYDGIFDSENWGGQKPQKPEIYYMPSSLTTLGADLHSCLNINNVVVFPEGVTEIPEQYTFFSIADRNFVFLGNVTLFNTNSTGLSNYYFINDSVTDEGLTGSRQDKYQLYFHSEGVHFCEKTETVTEATCVTNELATKICFCGEEMGEFELEGTSLGHSHTVYIGIVYENYFANGYYGTQCERCDDVKGEGVVAPIFEWVGYSCTEAAIGGSYSITQGYNVDRDALDAYVAQQGEGFSFGVVAAVNKTDGEVAPDLNTEYAFEFKNLIHDAFDIKVTGLTSGNLTTNIVLCAYVVDNGKAFYLDNGVTVDKLTGFSYEDVLAMQK